MAERRTDDIPTPLLQLPGFPSSPTQPSKRSGVLSLSWSMAQLGWIAGPLCMFLFASFTLVSALLLCDCYRSPDPDYGPSRNGSYSEAVRAILGDGQIKGNIGGVQTATTPKKVWSVSQALGDIAFAFPCSVILLEIQDTLKSPPTEKVTMKKASTMAICITTFFYLCCGGFGYAAFGNSTPGNLLTGFYEPYWLIDFTNACIVLHLIGGYQVFSQPQFAIVEKWFTQIFPNSGVLNHNHTLKLPSLPTLRFNLLRLCFRTAYVASTTGIAIMFPYFNQVVAVAGAFTFWPLVIYFPVEMYFVQANALNKPPPLTVPSIAQIELLLDHQFSQSLETKGIFQDCLPVVVKHKNSQKQRLLKDVV
ncbi:hypothetical protein RJ640_004945 [Escallonia rubra]|uniref:Amino acid transporter transmembrane domain-containing protein n=1 Tax=Escallonia rubra TaxID=112253 RepID=A0AA88S3J2_9ASTE|nr:hypothetical protein RJ640_004945 [Escallonia rubra]